MSAHRTLSRNFACLISGCLSLILFSGPAGACRLLAVIGNNLPDNLLQYHLIDAPNSLEQLSYSQLDGWGIGYYPQFGDAPLIARGAIRAYNDPAYDTAVADINLSKPKITIAHIRTCSSGCCSHDTDTIPDPHPFYRTKNGKTWIFVHNGGVSKSRMNTLLGDYLNANPPNGSGIPSCNPTNPNLVVDSELYFLFILKNIGANGWNAVSGITKATTEMFNYADSSAMNFIMSDGELLYVFRKGTDPPYTLYYLYDSENGYSAAASEYPNSSMGWNYINNYQLVVLPPGAVPTVVNDVRTFCAGDINEDKNVDTTDLVALAGHFGHSGNGDLDFDGDVDGADVATMIAAYGKACP
jgi:hypothetical protein